MDVQVEKMKRNTLVALVSWAGITGVLTSVERIREVSHGLNGVLIFLGVTYMLLIWSPLLTVKLVERRPITSLGFRSVTIPRGVFWAALSFSLVTVLVVFEMWSRVRFFGYDIASAAPAPSNLPAEIVMQLLMVGLPEEMYNRGYLLTRLGESWGLRPALFLSSFMFGIMHLAMGDLLRVVQAGISGLIYGWAFLKTGSLYIPITSHILVNLFAFRIAYLILASH